MTLTVHLPGEVAAALEAEAAWRPAQAGVRRHRLIVVGTERCRR
jgi:hypothetical protein